jgi:hypothetical protein
MIADIRNTALKPEVKILRIVIMVEDKCMDERRNCTGWWKPEWTAVEETWNIVSALPITQN